jgi:hypothetical protein
MAVRTEDTEVLQPVVSVVSVDVIEVKWQAFATPLRRAALGAHGKQQAFGDEAFTKA